MEKVGREPKTVSMAQLHGPGYAGAYGIGEPYSNSMRTFGDDFHIFAVEWIPRPDAVVRRW
jgi:beta-glucanase (GH16 family)